jgi:succinoglycan biosynthesis transport protein ExoP
VSSVDSPAEHQFPEASNVPGALETKIDLRAYWRTIVKRWPFVVLSTVLCLGAAFVLTYRQHKIYEATCQIVIESTAPQVLQDVKDVVELGSGTYWVNKEFFETQYRIIQSSAVAQRVVDKLGLAFDPDYAPYAAAGPDADTLGVARVVAQQVSVRPIKDSRIAQIVVRDQNPRRAAILANTVADTYIESNLDYKLEGSRAATSWLSEEEVTLRKKLEGSELALFKFKKDRGLLDVSIGDKQSMTLQILQNLNGKLADIRMKRLELESTRKMVQAAKDLTDKETLPLIESNNEAFKNMRLSFLQFAKEKADLGAKYGPEHPRIKILEGQMAAVQASYQREIDSSLRTFENSYQALLATEKSLMSMMDKEKQSAIELSKIDVEYKPYQRAAEENAKVYMMIAQRQKELDLTALMKGNNVRVLERAVAPGAPVSPRPMQNLMIALLAGLAIGIALAFLVETLDNTLKSQLDVEAFLGVPVLGLIPIIGSHKQEEKAALRGKRSRDRGDRDDRPDRGKDVEDAAQLRERDMGIFLDPRSLAAECCRSIRTNILFMSPDRPVRTMVITSPSPQEGKTTTAVNLAVAMAEAAGRVLVIDTDMRRPRLHRSFGVPNQTGISTVILGHSTLDEAIKKTEVPNLDVLPCGPLPPNPSELLHTQRFAQTLAECATRYDRIILDSPPTSAVTDPAVLGNLTDGVILIVKGGHTTREAAAQARRQLMSAKCHLLGVVVNEIDFSKPGYEYQYGYYRNYAQYGYIYGGKAEESGT